MNDPAVDVSNVSKHYGHTTALAGITLNVESGEIFGIIGPNGAGKSTLVNILAGLKAPDSGHVRVFGMDPQTSGRSLRERIGIQLQEASLQAQITVDEALTLYSSFYANPAPKDALVEEWNLTDKRKTQYRALSGGQKQRLLICLALVSNPELVILDELTTGLDPRARRESWQHVLRIRERGTTVILVTHYMEEVQRLCDQVVMVNRGRITASGSPAQLLERTDQSIHVVFTAPSGFRESSLDELDGVMSVRREGPTVCVEGNGYLMATVSQALAALGINPPDLRTESITLDDVFVQLTTEQESAEQEDPCRS